MHVGRADISTPRSMTSLGAAAQTSPQGRYPNNGMASWRTLAGF
jgi:hypothetical protein